MTDREICEQIIEQDGSCSGIRCTDDKCMFRPKGDLVINCGNYKHSEGKWRAEKVRLCKKHLAELDNEWKPIEELSIGEVLILSPKTTELQLDSGEKEWMRSLDFEKPDGVIKVIRNMLEGIKYRYRKRQPKEKSVEEMAEEYTKGMLFMYPPRVEQLDKSLQKAYITGYKAAKC